MSKHTALTPSIGVDAIWLKQDAFTAKLNGADAFDYASAEETFVRLPVGVRADWAARTNETTAWSAFADLSVAPQFGGTEADAEVTGVHTRHRQLEFHVCRRLCCKPQARRLGAHEPREP